MTTRDPNPDLSRGPRLGELRAIGELASLPAAMPLLLTLARRGDGHPVLVIPGLGAGDRSTRPLRNFLDLLGYRSSPWRQGRNRGRMAGLDESLASLLTELASAENVSGKVDSRVSLIGWSLGGVHALKLARRLPHLIRQVITLGSPLGDEQNPAPAQPYPITAIYSRSDAIVPWRLSRITARLRSENVEVHGSHLGLGVNPSVFLVIADRLAQPEGSWRRFERTGLRPFLYPDPER